ncbi:MAG: protein-S-isoprenylcysteine O-methyltransferase [Pseudomonadota bacterium]
MGNSGRFIGILFFSAVAGVLIWRLPINGWGSLVWFAEGFLVNLIRAPHAQRNKENVIVDTRRKLTERILLGFVMLGGSFIPILQLTTGVFNAANYALSDLATGFGVLLLAPALYLFWRSHADLGRNWSVTVELREGHTLVTEGIYKRIRHPMYSAIWLMVLAQPFLIHNWIAGFAGIVSFGLIYFIRVPYEERMMHEQFGDEYDDYCERSGRLWPKW